MASPDTEGPLKFKYRSDHIGVIGKSAVNKVVRQLDCALCIVWDEQQGSSMSARVLSRLIKVGASGILTISFCAASALNIAVCISAQTCSTLRRHPLQYAGLGRAIRSACDCCTLLLMLSGTAQVLPHSWCPFRDMKRYMDPSHIAYKAKQLEAVQSK